MLLQETIPSGLTRTNSDGANMFDAGVGME